MVTVYVVTGGIYSYYHIGGVFSTEGKAQEYIQSLQGRDRLSRGDTEINEWVVDDPEMYICHYIVHMDRNGNCSTFAVSGSRHGFIRWSEGGKTGTSPQPSLVWAVTTDDEWRAIKAVNEVRSQILTMNLWGDKRVGTSDILPPDGVVPADNV